MYAKHVQDLTNPWQGYQMTTLLKNRSNKSKVQRSETINRSKKLDVSLIAY